MKALKISAIALLVIIALLAATVTYLLSPVDRSDESKVDFVVSEGQKSAEVAKGLEEKGLIRNSFAFYLYLKAIDGKILPGIYELSVARSGSEIANQLASGKLKTSKITLIEGWRATQMEAYLVEEKKLTGLKGFGVEAQPYEGYLFPDTYHVKVDITTPELIELLRSTFNEKTSKLRLTPETVILASIVERESRSDADRPLVAGVYANRIRLGMKLDADPTVQYAKGSWAAITLSDYRQTISPYNTYINSGWPPGPICSPGLASLEAAAAPADHDNLFFFHAKGETHFSKTLAEHQAKVRQYL